jgi:3-phytase
MPVSTQRYSAPLPGSSVFQAYLRHPKAGSEALSESKREHRHRCAIRVRACAIDGFCDRCIAMLALARSTRFCGCSSALPKKEPPMRLAILCFAASCTSTIGGPPNAPGDDTPDGSDAGTTPDPTVTKLAPIFETQNEGAPTEADMDDPSVWVHPTKPDGSLIVAAAKKGGLRVYNLKGELVQTFLARTDAAGKPLNRYNNVDVQYNFNLNGTRVDIAVASDRIQDKIAVWKIDPTNASAPLVEITSIAMPRAFPTRPDPADRDDQIANPNDGKNTAYGLALYRDKGADRIYALVTQNAEAVIRHFELVATTDNKVSATVVATYQFPYTFMGQDLTIENELDANQDFSPQFEGMAVDQRTGIAYVGHEDVGLFRIDLKKRTAEMTPFYTTSRFNASSKLARDTEGVSIYYAPTGGYILVSSQGMAHGEAPNFATPGLDDTFALFSLAAPNAYLGSFSLGASGTIDAVQECDGADIASVALPGFPHGMLITQDGYNDDLNSLDGVTKATNLKITPWEGVADNFPGGLTKSTTYDPRNP